MRMLGLKIGLLFRVLVATGVVTGVIVAVSADANAAALRGAHTIKCGSLTFNEAADQPVTYLGINATGIGCSPAKKLLAKAGKQNGSTPAGWTFGDTVADTKICGFSYKHGAEKIVFHTLNNGEGC